tara:strand:+ start:3751 stop:4299 length:549 start_codon:yes stop_codon:yes gene_type:complete
MSGYVTQNDLLLKNLTKFYSENDRLDMMLRVINGESKISLRIVDWFVTNYSKEKYVVYTLDNGTRLKVYDSYKLNLRAYSKKRFDPFCRWDRITIPYKNESHIQTTIGQLNFFKWAIENNILEYINDNYKDIEKDMNNRNSTSRKNQSSMCDKKTRKKREELSISAVKSIKKETIDIIVKFD